MRRPGKTGSAQAERSFLAFCAFPVKEAEAMFDVFAIVLTILFFAIAAAYVRGCEKL
jgi:hypothetical protein